MPKIIRLIYSFCCLNAGAAFAQYPVSDIAPQLKDGADMIVRLSEKEIQLKNKSTALIRNHYVYTILNSDADAYAEMVLPYDKLRKVSSVEGTIYGADGAKIRSLKKSEVKDYSNTDESNLADDDRVKHHSFGHRIYPYTVEYETVVEYDGLFSLPAWVPVLNEKVAIQRSTFKVIAANDYLLRYKSFNYNGGPSITEVKKMKEYQWTVADLKAVEDEPYKPSWYEITPTVLIAPSAFEMQRYSGNLNTWKDFGDFMYKLNAGRDQLPANIKQKVHQLTDGVNDPKKKIEILYKYLQQNTRYISIQLGIGGWQTLDANFVATNGYGDCKALSNYMTALLKEASIPSYTVLIKSGRNENNLISDFSSNQFNHVVVCVPQGKDSTWLECTSRTTPVGYMGSFTGNRQALLVSETGGMLVSTPFYKATDNLLNRKITATVAESGELLAEVSNYYTGIQQDRLDGLLKNSSNTQFKEYMRNKFDLPAYEIVEFSHASKPGFIPSIEEKLKLKVQHYGSVTGKRLFINPNILSVSSFKIRDAANRKYDFEMKTGFIDTDTVEIQIPAGYKPESVPLPVEISTPFSTYKAAATVQPGKIIYVRYYNQQAGRIAAGKVKEVADFFEKIYKADHSRIVLVKEAP